MHMSINCLLRLRINWQYVFFVERKSLCKHHVLLGANGQNGKMFESMKIGIMDIIICFHRTLTSYAIQGIVHFVHPIYTSTLDNV